MSSTKRLFSKSIPSAMAWMSCGQSVIASMASIWTRYHSRPLTPSAGSQKMGRTHWLMDIKMQSPQAWQRWNIEELFNAWEPHPAVVGVSGGTTRKFFPDKATRRPILQVIQQGIIGLGQRSSQTVHLKRPHRFCSASTATFQLARLVKEANANSRGDFLLLQTHRAAGNYRGGLLCHSLCLDGIWGLFTSQPGHFNVQNCYDARQPSHPLRRPLTWREAHLLSILVPKQPLNQGPVPAFYNALVPVNINTSTSNKTPCFASTWLTAPMISRLGSTLSNLGHFNRHSPVDAR